MPTGLKRYYGKGDLHFVTFSCCKRLPLLKTKTAMTLFVAELVRARAEYHFRLVGYVLMPNHVHLLMSEPPKGSVSTVLQMLKQRVARGMKRDGRSPSLEDGEEPRSFWQPRFYDFNVYNRGKVVEKLHYMHANPVKNGLVKHPRDRAWSRLVVLLWRAGWISAN